MLISLLAAIAVARFRLSIQHLLPYSSDDREMLPQQRW